MSCEGRRADAACRSTEQATLGDGARTTLRDDSLRKNEWMKKQRWAVLVMGCKKKKRAGRALLRDNNMHSREWLWTLAGFLTLFGPNVYYSPFGPMFIVPCFVSSMRSSGQCGLYSSFRPIMRYYKNAMTLSNMKVSKNSKTYYFDSKSYTSSGTNVQSYEVGSKVHVCRNTASWQDRMGGCFAGCCHLLGHVSIAEWRKWKDI